MTTVTASGLADNTQYTFKLMRPAAVDSQDADTVISTTVSVSSGSGNLSLDLPANVNNTYYWADFGDPLYTFSVPASGGPYAITAILITPVRAVVRFPVETVNGHTGPDVVISSSDLSGDLVSQVNGKTGDVTLDASDVSALPASTTAEDIGAMVFGTNFEIQAFDGTGTQAFTAFATTDGEDPPTFTTQITLDNLESMGVVTAISQGGTTYTPTDGVVDLLGGGGGMTWKGNFDPASTYDENDVVRFNKGLYIANASVAAMTPSFVGSQASVVIESDTSAVSLTLGGTSGLQPGDLAIVEALSSAAFTESGFDGTVASQSNTGNVSVALYKVLTSTDISNGYFGSITASGTDKVTTLLYVLRNVVPGGSATTNSTATTTATTAPADGVFLTWGSGQNGISGGHAVQAALTHLATIMGNTSPADGLIGGMGYDPMTEGTNSTPRTFTASTGGFTNPLTWVWPVPGADPSTSALWDLMVQGV